MNVSSVKTKEYENKRLFRRGEKQTQSNPIKPNCKPTTPIFKISLKNTLFLDFLSFFLLFFLSSVFSIFPFTLLIPAVPAGRLVLSFGGKDSGK
jgi:hypothetical protein